MLIGVSSNHQMVIGTLCIFLILDYFRAKFSGVNLGNPQAIIQVFAVFYVILPYFILSTGHINDLILTETVRYIAMCILAYQLITTTFVKGNMVIRKQTGIQPKHLLLLKVLIILSVALLLVIGAPERGQTVTGGMSAITFIIQSVRRFLTIAVIIFCSKKQFRSVALYLVLGASIDIVHASKALIFTYYMLPILIRYYSHSLTFKSVTLLTGLVAIILFPLTYAVKKLDLAVTLTNLQHVLSLASEIITDGRLVNLIVGRLTMIEPVSRIMYYGEQTARELVSNFQLNNTIFPHFFNSFIPKFLYSGRIEADIGRLNGYYFGWNEDVDGAFVSASVFGEMFINFGWIGVIAMSLLALFHAIMHNTMLKFDKNYFIVSVHYLFIIFIILQGLEGHFVGRLVPFIKMSMVAMTLIFAWHIIYKIFPKKSVR